jgi:acetyl esterase
MTQMTKIAEAAPDASTDPRIDPQIRSFLADIDKDSSPFWELPQPKPQQILTELQSKTPRHNDRANRHAGWAHR